MLIIPFIIRVEIKEIHEILKSELGIVGSPLLIPIIFYLLYLLWSNKSKMENEINKKILNSIFLLSIIFLPGILLDFLNQKTEVEWKIIPYGFTFSSIYYLCWNIISIVFVVQYFMTKINIIPAINISSGFIKKYAISEKELEVISLILKGYSNQEIADHLFIATQTVKNHIYNIFQKVNIKSRSELVNIIAQFI